jgi:NAD(P)-dependent dehydrogenase (short-subunit alcohol dehydrogenase family)
LEHHDHFEERIKLCSLPAAAVYMAAAIFMTPRPSTSMDHSHFRGGVAVVTGAGSGFGMAMAQRFAAAGMRLVAMDIDGARAEQAAESARACGVDAMSRQVDVANRAAVEAAAMAADDAFGACTILCANVGVQQFGAIDRLTEQDWRWVLDVNVMGVVHTVNAFLPLLRKTQGQRHVAITASSAALTPGVRMAAYTTSKYAVTGYGETLRMELAGEGVGVSIIFPAGMMTRHLESSVAARPAELGKSELRREDIAVMMASRKMDAASHVATAEYATRNILEDLAANERYIITHGEYRDSLIANHADVMRAHERAQRD